MALFEDMPALPPKRLGRGERFLLVFLSLVFVALVASIFFWPGSATSPLLPSEGGGDAESIPPSEELRTVSGDRPIELPEELRTQIKESTDLERVVRETEPFAYLVAETARRSYRFLASQGFEKIDPKKVLDSPGAFRAAPVEVKGTLLEFTEIPPPEGSGPVRRLFQGTIELEEKAEDGRPHVAFFALIDEPPGDVEVGLVYRVQGTFFKAYEDLVPQGDSRQHRVGPFVIGKRMMRSYVYETVAELDVDLLNTVDEDPEGDGIETLEFRPYYHALSFVRNRDSAPEAPPEVTWQDLWNDPVGHRGQWVRLVGTVKHIERQDLPDNPAGLTHVYRIILLTGERRLAEVMLPEKPEGIALHDWVTVDGIFFKNHAYENRGTGAGNLTRAPVVIGKSVRIREIDHTVWEQAQQWIGILAIVMLVVFTVALFKDRQGARAFTEAHAARQKRRHAKRDLNLELRGRARLRPAEATAARDGEPSGPRPPVEGR
jgi:hypothetical protein